METKVRWAGEATFIGENSEGHKIVMDGPPAGGGRNLGARPMETLLMAMGACSAYDVVSILKKSRQQVSDCELSLRASRADEPPQVFTEINLHFVVSGDGLTEKAVQRAVELSAEKYCSASIMLGKTASITHDFEIRDSLAGDSA